MPLLKPHKIANTSTFDSFLVLCPACKAEHVIVLKSRGKYINYWNGDHEKPTFNISITNMKNTKESVLFCHAFIEKGYWKYLSDSTHEMSGQIVPMIDMRC